MRIVAGTYGGRSIIAPKSSGTRPMTDKVRAALFDSLGDLQDVSVLDAYAGSGAVGFEAFSRGAGNVEAIEQAWAAVKVIKANQAALGIDWGYALHQVTVESWLAHQTDKRFDIVIADPPYERIKVDVLEKLGRLLAPQGLLVVSHSSRVETPKLEGLTRISNKVYGDSTLSTYQA
ncbi:MAG TPA: 16S rRNA (guanine(966)-N(2))-methyltransferase RsmD [Candidatus Polarisedimenticolaceae bacterium]|nr:16S rRNA (guanine(966)-N(2))-methyltransferase RsmD [Candidatus Polarisedimenticolaceae bacterium]